MHLSNIFESLLEIFYFAFLSGIGSSYIDSHERLLSYLPRTFPDKWAISFCMHNIFALFPKSYKSRFSFRLSCRCWALKYYSAGSWQKRSVNTYLKPWFILNILQYQQQSELWFALDVFQCSFSSPQNIWEMYFWAHSNARHFDKSMA